MSYDVMLYEEAEEQIKSLSKNRKQSILDEIEDCSETRNPQTKRNVEELHHADDIMRIRVGSYRVIFAIAGSDMLVFRVLNRNDNGMYRDVEKWQKKYDSVTATS